MANRMTQVATRLDDRLVADLDSLVAAGHIASRSEGIRVAVERLVDEQRRRRIGAEIVAGYERYPETAEEIACAERITRALIEEEPW
jgi:metal-responsive CopG/Arc/MetJ family transcriptional regulator